jgi:hypothetical protein
MEKRNVKITIEQAKEWLKNDQFKEIALEAFPELKEKSLPKTWEELEIIKGYYTEAISSVFNTSGTTATHRNKNIFATKEQAEASIAMAQLSQLKKVYNGDWEADWNNCKTDKYVIFFNLNEIKTCILNNSSEFLSFKDHNTRDLFLENFKELILKARPLMS